MSSPLSYGHCRNPSHKIKIWVLSSLPTFRTIGQISLPVCRFGHPAASQRVKVGHASSAVGRRQEVTWGGGACREAELKRRQEGRRSMRSWLDFTPDYRNCCCQAVHIFHPVTEILVLIRVIKQGLPISKWQNRTLESTVKFFIVAAAVRFSQKTANKPVFNHPGQRLHLTNSLIVPLR